MRVLKFKRRIEIDKTIGNFHISTFHYGGFDKKGKSKHWTELHCWCECDCGYCPLSWENSSYEGECYDYGCFLAKKGHDNASMLICMLPNWVKKILLRYKVGKEGDCE